MFFQTSVLCGGRRTVGGQDEWQWRTVVPSSFEASCDLLKKSSPIQRCRCTATVALELRHEPGDCILVLPLHTPKTFITSSPKWLMTLTAILPPFGRSNGRDVSE